MEDDGSSSPPPGYPRDFHTDKYRIEETGNDIRIVTHHTLSERSSQNAASDH